MGDAEGNFAVSGRCNFYRWDPFGCQFFKTVVIDRLRSVAQTVPLHNKRNDAESSSGQEPLSVSANLPEFGGSLEEEVPGLRRLAPLDNMERFCVNRDETAAPNVFRTSLHTFVILPLSADASGATAGP